MRRSHTNRASVPIFVAAAAAFFLSPTSQAQPTAIEIVDAWAPAAPVGSNAPLAMTVVNHGVDDSIVRVRCEASNFMEKQKIDYGEGAPSGREVSSIPIPANQETTISSRGYRLMLLQLRQNLAAGDRFKCATVFAKAGTLEVEVQVRPAPPV
jgi:copper(I)-binding protein